MAYKKKMEAYRAREVNRNALRHAKILLERHTKPGANISTNHSRQVRLIILNARADDVKQVELPDTWYKSLVSEILDGTHQKKTMFKKILQQ